MNDWLSKIEQHDHEVREQYPEMGSDEFESEKMARVIREQSAYIKLLTKKYGDALVLHHIHGMGTVDAELKEAFDNLSPDAKELIPKNEEL